MKKIIIITGIVCANLMLAGALLKAMHIAGASLLLLISILAFCIIFLPLALLFNYKEQEEKNYKWLYIVTFIVFSFDLIGALFKILHWQYAGVFMIIGVPLPFVLFLPVYLYSTRKNKSLSLLNQLGVIFGLTFLALFSVLLTLNISSSLVQNFSANSFNSDKSTTFYQIITKGNTSDDKVKQKADELCKYIDELKCKLLTETNNDCCENGKLKEDYNPMNLSNPAAQTSILINGDASSDIKILVDKMIEFNALVSSSKSNNKELLELTQSLLNIDNNVEENGSPLYLNWYQKEFPINHLSVFLDVLSRVQSNVRFVEAEYLASI